MKTESIFIGQDDDGNEVYILTIHSPSDPDNGESFIHTKQLY